MQNTLIAVLGLAGLGVAQSTTSLGPPNHGPVTTSYRPTTSTTTTASSTPSSYGPTCKQSYETCSNAPDANHSYCASIYAGCLGYNPFTTTASTTLTSYSTTTTTPSSTPSGYGPTCKDAYETCSTAPDANHSYCASIYAGCLGYNPFTSTVSTTSTSCTTTTPSSTPSGYGPTCKQSYETCSTAPDANHSYCASIYAGCLGYNPFTSTVSATSTTSCTTTSPSSTPSGYGPTCKQSYETCSNAPDANHSYCASIYAGCLGYNPFTSTISTSTTSCTTSSASSTPSGYAPTCKEAYETCSHAINANHSYCASIYAGCLGYNPFTSTVSTTTDATLAPPTTRPFPTDEPATASYSTSYTESATLVAPTTRPFSTDEPATATYSTSYTTTAIMATGTIATVASGEASGTPTAPAIYTGAANKATVGGLLGAAMAAAALL